jgi:hypothetical protein
VVAEQSFQCFDMQFSHSHLPDMQAQLIINTHMTTQKPGPEIGSRECSLAPESDPHALHITARQAAPLFQVKHCASKTAGEIQRIFMAA